MNLVDETLAVMSEIGLHKGKDMTITRKFYSRYHEALKHLAVVTRWVTSYSRTAHATEAVTIRLEGPGGEIVQLLRMSAFEAERLGRYLIEYGEADRASRTEAK